MRYPDIGSFCLNTVAKLQQADLTRHRKQGLAYICVSNAPSTQVKCLTVSSQRLATCVKAWQQLSLRLAIQIGT
ncbi:hypothetical protein O9992_15920 [Vibrio lentus]|nr:hypothetical protein [Vibrio lentus]